MKKNPSYKFFVGIDISKLTLDFSVLHQQKEIYSCRVSNNLAGLKSLEKQLRANKIDPNRILYCCENTGIYTSPLLAWCEKKAYKLWLETPLAIKKSLGLVRGKSDKADALRIAIYAFRFQDKCILWIPSKASIVKLQKFWKARATIVKLKKQIQQALNEIRDMQGMVAHKGAKKIYQYTLNGLERDFKQIEEEMRNTLKEDPELNDLFKMVTSVDGIGNVIATYLIAMTNGFSKFASSKKLACYAGVVPFSYRSGTSIRGKERVSPYANKTLKSLLHLGALSVIHMKRKGDLSAYYERKIAEGKHKMLIINAVRNKLLHRVWACVRDKRSYEKKYEKKVA